LFHHDDVRPGGVLGRSKAAAGIDVPAVDVGPIRGVELHARVELAVLVLERGVAGDVRRHRVDGRQSPNPRGFVDRDPWIATLGAGVGVGRITVLETGDRSPIDEERRGSGSGDVAGERLIDAPDHGAQRDDDEHTDGHAHDRERRA